MGPDAALGAVSRPALRKPVDEVLDEVRVEPLSQLLVRRPGKLGSDSQQFLERIPRRLLLAELTEGGRAGE